MTYLPEADQYFSVHPEKDFWFSLDSERRQAVLRLAAFDIAAHLGRTEPDQRSAPQVNAVCEQAVYLAANYEKLVMPFEITSESLAGVGSRNYRSRPVAELSRRALRFIRLITGGGNRIARG